MPDGSSRHNGVLYFLLRKVRQILGVNIGAVCRETDGTGSCGFVCVQVHRQGPVIPETSVKPKKD